MNLATELYRSQLPRWPSDGRHILAHHDDRTIVVYQAYRPSIGKYAIEHQRLGGPEFSMSRMSWIKPNFLWMMYRCGWGTKADQEMTLALRIQRDFFDEILEQAVPSSYDPAWAPSQEGWKAAVEASNVRLQWDPDHSPSGARQARRAIQLGLRGNMLQRFAHADLLEVIDLTDFVAKQRLCLTDPAFAALEMPIERAYLPRSAAAAERVRLQTPPDQAARQR